MTLFRDEFAGQTRVFPAGRQQNLVGSSGPVPGPEAGGLGGVRDGVVSESGEEEDGGGLTGYANKARAGQMVRDREGDKAERAASTSW